MKIDFANIDFKKEPAFKGGDGVFSVKTAGDKACKIMYGRLEKGRSIGMHRHEGSCEAIYVTRGEGRMSYEGEEQILRAGDCHYCGEGKAHSFRNDGDEPLEFFAVVPAFSE